MSKVLNCVKLFSLSFSVNCPQENRCAINNIYFNNFWNELQRAIGASGLQRAIGMGSKELLEWAPKSYWSGLQRAIGVGSKELLEWAPKS